MKPRFAWPGAAAARSIAPIFRIGKTILPPVLIWLAVSFSQSTSAFASLKIDERSPHAKLWQQIYDRLPALWKTRRTIVVQETSPEELNSESEEEGGSSSSGSAQEQDDSIDGEYEPGDVQLNLPPLIRLSSALEAEEAGFVFAHEYGHFVWDEILTQAQRKHYSRIWEQQKRNGHLVTEYAQESVNEGFAEAFASFLQRPEELRRRDNLSWQFLLSLKQPAKSSNPEYSARSVVIGRRDGMRR